MLRSLGAFVPFGQVHVARHPHLVEEVKRTRQVDFSSLSKTNASNRNAVGRGPQYRLFPLDDRPLKLFDERFDEILEWKNKSNKRRVVNIAFNVEEELYVENSTVVWSRERQIVQSLKYQHEQQLVETAMFAWFPFQVTRKGEQHLQWSYSPVVQWEKPDEGLNASMPSDTLLSVFSSTPIAGKKRSAPSDTAEISILSDRSQHILRRGLCVILHDTIKIYFSDGLKYFVNLPFPVQNAHALEVGLLLERKRGEVLEDFENLSLLRPPTFLSITNPLGEPKAVSISDDGNNRYPFWDTAELIFTSMVFDPSSAMQRQLVLLYDSSRNSLAVCLYMDEHQKRQTPKIVTPAKKRPKPTKNTKQAKKNLKSPSIQPAPLTRKDSLAQFHEDLSSDTDHLYGSEAGDSISEQAENNGLTLSIVYELETGRPTSVFIAHDINGKEQLCIMKKESRQLWGIDVPLLFSHSPDPVAFKVRATSAAAINSRFGCKDIIIIRDNKVQLLLDYKQQMLLPLKLKTDETRSPQNLIDATTNRLSIVFTGGRVARFQVDISPRSALVQDALAALHCALSPVRFNAFRMRFLKSCFAAVGDHTGRTRSIIEWECFVVALLSFFPIAQDIVEMPEADVAETETETEQDDLERLQELIQRAQPEFEGITFTNELDSVIRYLHVQYENYRISSLKRECRRHLGQLLVLLCSLVSAHHWVENYVHQGIVDPEPLQITPLQGNFRISKTYPPDIICTLLYYPPTAANPCKLEDIFSVPRLIPSPGVGDHSYALALRMVWGLYEALNTGSAENLVLRMVRDDCHRADLHNLEQVVAEPLFQVLDGLKESPTIGWPREAYEIIERRDMAEQLRCTSHQSDPNAKHAEFVKSNKVYLTTPSTTGRDDALDVSAERLRFGYRGVLETVRSALDVTRLPELTVPERPDLSDADLAAEHQTHVQSLVQRTVALGVGKGIFSFGTCKPDLTKAFPIDTINLSAKVLPLRTVVTADDKVWVDDYLDWPQFHVGVAAGLSLSLNHDVNGSWINFCMPQELKPQHGGFFLGIGLNGKLKQLPLNQWIGYVGCNCELATAGFVLGASAAYIGSKHTNITKLLAIHIPSLLPAGSTALRDSILLQATCLLGIGLVHVNSNDRRLCAAMIDEMERYAAADPSGTDPNYASCALAAGFALGLVALGEGDEIMGLADLKIKYRLLRLMTGHASHSGKNNASTARNGTAPRPINLDATSIPATLALGLIFLRTENRRVAERLEIMDSRPILDYVRADFLMVRTIAKNLIMWNTIQPSSEWIESQLPTFLAQQNDDADDLSWQAEVCKQAKYNIIAGACLSIGLRYAGSSNADAFQCLLARLDWFLKLSNIAAVTFQQHLTKSAIRTCINVTATAAAMVMAGTGNLELRERLHRLYQRIGPHTCYGDHMAASMALGLLYVGLGGYTLKTTNIAIAGLLAAFYPFYPTSPDDNRYHIQAFRHLWTLAVDVRWLTPYDMDKKTPCRVPLILTLYEDNPSVPREKQKTRKERVIAPTVVPAFSLIKNIQVDSARYYPLSVPMDGGEYANALTRSGVLYIQRRPNWPTYDECPVDPML